MLLSLQQDQPFQSKLLIHTRGCARHNFVQTVNLHIGADFAKNANKQAKMSITALAWWVKNFICFEIDELNAASQCSSADAV